MKYQDHNWSYYNDACSSKRVCCNCGVIEENIAPIRMTPDIYSEIWAQKWKSIVSNSSPKFRNYIIIDGTLRAGKCEIPQYPPTHNWEEIDSLVPTLRCKDCNTSVVWIPSEGVFKNAIAPISATKNDLEKIPTCSTVKMDDALK